jgi:hypothetical protein
VIRMLDTRLRLYDLTEKIDSKDIRAFTHEALYNAPKKFWEAPSSSSGRYHPPEDQGKGGLVRHIIKATCVAEELSRFYDLKNEDKDIVIAATLLHDIKKNGLRWGEMTDYTHGLIAYNWLSRFNLKDPSKTQIRNCVRYHMGRWVQPESELERALNPTIHEQIVQLSDYISSRKSISFMPPNE